MLLLIDDVQLFEAAAEAERFGVAIAQVFAFDGAAVSIRDANGAESRLTKGTRTCIGLVSLGRSRDTIDALTAWWREAGDELPLTLVPPDASADARRLLVLERVAMGLKRSHAAIAQEYRSVVQQNRTLRRSCEALQSAYDRVERYIVENRLHAPDLHFETTPDVWWAPSAAGCVIRQTLPILATHFSFLELHLHKNAPTGEGEISVRLLLEPVGSVLAEWTLGSNDLNEGWNAFYPPPSVDAENEVVAEVRWSGVPGVAEIGLDRSRSHFHSVARIGDEPSMEPPGDLAMRVWRELSGVRTPESRRAAGHSRRLTLLPPGDLLRAGEHDFGHRRLPGQNAVMATNGRLLVHPFGASSSIAKLPNPLPSGVTTVSVEGRTIDERASPIAYAIAVLPPEEKPEACFETMTNSAPGFSGWRVLDPLQSRRIELRLARPTNGEHLLYLATRLPLGSRGAFAWSTWRDVQIGFEGAPDGAQSEISQLNRNIASGCDEGSDIFWKGSWRTPLDMVATRAPMARSAVRAICAAASRVNRLARHKK